MFGTNYSGRGSKHGCPECPCESLTLSLKQEAMYFKYWFNCHDCGFETRTCRGPSPEDGGELGVDVGADKFAQKTIEQAEEDPPF